MEEQKNNPLYSDTAYDDAFRTMETVCDDLVIPFVNLMFEEKYDSTAVIKRLRNEHFVEHEDEATDKRITDSFFEIIWHGITKRYHLECESKKYSDEILIRIFEYSSQIAKENNESSSYKVRFNFPNSGLLLLKKADNAPDKAIIELDMPGGKTVSYNVPLVKMSDFTEDDIFDKEVYMLLPFLIFNYEEELKDVNDSEERLEAFFEKYKNIYDRLDEELESGNLSRLKMYPIRWTFKTKGIKVQSASNDVMMNCKTA
ncbi:hypothetical protein [Butyrivibrio sp. YAB3001]|uniref:hypothetical protein n=1 Tax=Butyrivibrio sp. YAB3001 TaxID=1520812 RepID=UPI0008F65554|nr:hypothetical protein [Butyrivibrio sp. YAB3001]SFD03464.1 hypothetical protein SAMN02910398_03841 [Butyrivibrio sp. YAB3001]